MYSTLFQILIWSSFLGVMFAEAIIKLVEFVNFVQLSIQGFVCFKHEVIWKDKLVKLGKSCVFWSSIKCLSFCEIIVIFSCSYLKSCCKINNTLCYCHIFSSTKWNCYIFVMPFLFLFNYVSQVILIVKNELNQ